MPGINSQANLSLTYDSGEQWNLEGLGKGWEIGGISTYEPSVKVLVIAGQGTYMLSQESDGQFHFEAGKQSLNIDRFEQVIGTLTLPQGSTPYSYVITMADGSRQYLEALHLVTGERIARTVASEDRNGNGNLYRYDCDTGALRSITSNSGQTISLTTKGGTSTFLFPPAADGQQRRVELSRLSGYLHTITESDGHDQLTYTLATRSYQHNGETGTYVSDITYPTGMQAILDYTVGTNKSVLICPGAGSCNASTATDQPYYAGVRYIAQNGRTTETLEGETVQPYASTVGVEQYHNYTGYPWVGPSNYEDILLNSTAVDGFRYRTQSHAGETSETSTFNHQQLPITETRYDNQGITTMGEVEQTTMHYPGGDAEGHSDFRPLPFAAQSLDTYQLPLEVSVRPYQFGQAGQALVSHMTYDAYGEVTEAIAPDGSETLYTYAHGTTSHAGQVLPYALLTSEEEIPAVSALKRACAGEADDDPRYTHYTLGENPVTGVMEAVGSTSGYLVPVSEAKTTKARLLVKPSKLEYIKE